VLRPEVHDTAVSRLYKKSIGPKYVEVMIKIIIIVSQQRCKWRDGCTRRFPCQQESNGSSRETSKANFTPTIRYDSRV